MELMVLHMDNTSNYCIIYVCLRDLGWNGAIDKKTDATRARSARAHASATVMPYILN